VPPLVTLMPMASSAAMIEPQAKPAAMRAPVRMSGTALGRTTLRRIRPRPAPSAWAACTSLRSIRRTAWIVLSTNGKNAA